MTETIRIAIQKKGRLYDDTLSLLRSIGLEFEGLSGSLISQASNFPLEVLSVRNDDIPGLVATSVADLGIVGANTILEQGESAQECSNIAELNFGQCRLSIAVPEDGKFQSVADLQEATIATSYPTILRAYLSERKLSCEIYRMSGSVEAAPELGLADVICDLVSSGNTLRSNGLVELDVVMTSYAQLVQTSQAISVQKAALINIIVERINAVTEMVTYNNTVLGESAARVLEKGASK